jgi:hypothetical protein
MKIQPITTWFNGEPQTASNFTLRGIADDFTTSATLYYELQKEVVTEEIVTYDKITTKNIDSNIEETIDGNVVNNEEIQKEVISQLSKSLSYENLITATLDINGQDYQDWSAEPDANAWIYNWAANKLKLVLIP